MKPQSKIHCLFHLMVIIAALSFGQAAQAVPVAPGDTVLLSGTSAAENPDLAGVVVRDTLIPFQVRDRLRNVLIEGMLQDRVVRSDNTGKLIFAPRLRDLSMPIGAGTAWIVGLRADGYSGVLTDIDFSLTGLGDVGPNSVSRSSGSGDQLFFLYDPNLIVPPDEGRFLLSVTNASEFDTSGTVTIAAQNDFGAEVFSTTLSNTAAPVAPPLAPLYMSLGIEDALEGVAVNKVVGDTDGPTHYTRVEIVAKILSFSASAKDDIPVVLTIPSDLFGAPVQTTVRNSNGGSATSVPYENLGDGRYRVTADLSPVTIFPGITLFYQKQIVWRFLIPNDTVPQDVTVNAEVQLPSADPISSGRIRILAPGSVRSLIVANRKLLFDNNNESEVSSLLQRLFTEAQGSPASHTPLAVIYYAERYHSYLYNWDNTAVDYANEATANLASNALDDLVEDWYEDTTAYLLIYIPGIGTIRLPVAYPDYLLMVGNDEELPFYRYDDPYNDEAGWSVTSATNPAIRATDHDYFFTDNPYADVSGSNWQTGDIELWVGRLLGDTAGDMLSLLVEGVDWNNGRTGGVVMASVDGWEVGLEPDDGRAGEIADLYDVPSLFRGKGFAVRNDDVPATEVRTIDVMSPFEGGDTSWNTNFRNAANNAGGMDLFFIGGHDGYDHAVIPGNDFSPDDTPGLYTRFDDDHPISMIVGCHGGLPVPDIGVPGGADHSMVYDLVNEGARAYIGATGYSYGSPNNLHRNTWGERLIQRFFGNLLTPGGSNSMTIGKAMTVAKRDYTFGFGANDALDRKTVTEFNVYGVPWSFLFYPNALAGVSDAAEVLKVDLPAERAYTTTVAPAVAAEEGVYTQTFEIVVDAYEVQKEVENGITYELFSVKGGDVAIAPGDPVLPFIRGYDLPLPVQAKITAVNILKTSAKPIGMYNVPIARVRPWTEGGLSYTTKTSIFRPYPADADLVQYQATNNGVVFTVFPIQHNPATDETVFHNYFAVQVTYEAPLSVAVTDFDTNKARYAPGETIGTITRIANVGGADATLSARLEFKNALGEVVGNLQSSEFVVRAGASYTLPLSWSGELSDGTYTAQISVFSGKSAVGGASAGFAVTGGEITQVTAPAMLGVGEEGVFTVTFANYRTTAVDGEVRLSMQDTGGGLVQDLPLQQVVFPAGSSETAKFTWKPLSAGSGNYSATATVLVSDQTYGPVAETFEVCGGDTDTDGDCVADNVDNCTLVHNPAQRDTDIDGYGNICDPDFDNNDTIDFKDLARLKSEYFGSDPLTDLDGDGKTDFADLAILKSMFFGPPGPSGLAP